MDFLTFGYLNLLTEDLISQKNTREISEFFLLRIYEIENSFQESEIKIASSRIDHLISNTGPYRFKEKSH